MALGARGGDRFLWVVVAVAASAVIAVAISRGRSRQGPAAKGSTAAVSLPLLDGKGRASIAPGRVTIVDFWATWCAPCRVSMPRVQTVWHEYRARGVDLYSVDTDDAGAEREMQVHEFLRSNGLDFPFRHWFTGSLTAVESLVTELYPQRMTHMPQKHE